MGGFRLTACNIAATREGLTPGQLLTDARTLCPSLQLRAAEPEADARALASLATWATRYTPWVAPATGANGNDGIFLDVTGCAHLFGGEGALLDDLVGRLKDFGFAARGALTGTLGASWALARFGPRFGPRLEPRFGDGGVIAEGGEQTALAPLPIAALRLSEHVIDGLNQVGLKRVSDLMRTPRAPLTARFGPDPFMRLDQALGSAPEPISPQATATPLRAILRLVEPIMEMDAVAHGIGQLCEEIETGLIARGKGARALRLSLFRVDGDVATLEVGTARPQSEASHLARLLRERLERRESDLDAGFGYDVIALDVLRSDALSFRQNDLDTDDQRSRDRFSGDLASFVDRAGNRFGWARVRHLHGAESHIPERAVMASPAHVGPPSLDWAEETSRPMALLPCAEPIDVVAEVPEGPPRTFRWRRVTHKVARAEGPERIAPEWWRDNAARTRDYYRIEDDAGRRFWIYREGLYGRDVADPRWYMHGFFG